MGVIEVLHLIDRLESLVSAGIRFPMTSKAVVDEQEFLEIVDQLRVAIPEEIKQAKRLSVEKDRVIGTAKNEAEKILITAQERAAIMLKDNEVVKLAEQQAQAIVTEAEQAAEEIRAGADYYALEVLAGLETELNRLLAQVKKGRATLERVSKEAATFRESRSNLGSSLGREASERHSLDSR
ncbi:MAG: ATPase [Chloroflexi bacterium]|nr:ATPase [Chloroflexota bacterium]